MLKVDHASVFFAARDGRTVHALDRVSFDIPERGFVVALGASGCGKSTLLNAIAGFLPLSDGRITLDGRAVEQPGADRGVVFQKDSLLPWKSVVDNVALGLKFAGVKRKGAKRAPWSFSGSSASTNSLALFPTSCRAACASVSASRGLWRQIPTSC